jgi:heme-degrading monooxygenase HmoA
VADTKEWVMQVVLIDTFVVPEDSKSELLEKARMSAGFLKTLPGFVEGFVYERTDGESPYNVVTTAVWKDNESYENARKVAAAEFQKIGFSPQETMKKLRVEFKRAVYRRAPY